MHANARLHHLNFTQMRIFPLLQELMKPTHCADLPLDIIRLKGQGLRCATEFFAPLADIVRLCLESDGWVWRGRCHEVVRPAEPVEHDWYLRCKPENLLRHVLEPKHLCHIATLLPPVIQVSDDCRGQCI